MAVGIAAEVEADAAVVVAAAAVEFAYDAWVVSTVAEEVEWNASN